MTTELALDSLQPGILISETLSREGGILYDRKLINSFADGESRVKEWETKSTILNETEYEERTQIISKAYAKVRKLCVGLSIGLWCPESKADDLHAAITEVYQQVEEFNNRSTACKIKARYGLFRVSATDDSVISSVADKVAEIASGLDKALHQSDLDTLRAAPSRFLKGMTAEVILSLPEKEKNAVLARCRAELIRSTVVEVKGLENLLPALAMKELKDVVSQAKQTARTLCKRVEKNKEDMQKVIEETRVVGVDSLRSSYVNLSMQAARSAAEKITASISFPERRLLRCPDLQTELPDQLTSDLSTETTG